MADSGGRGKLQGLRILIVDDAKHVRDAFTLLLQEEGAAVLAIGTGREAIEIAGQRAFDVLLTDLKLPDMSGDMLIRQIIDGASRRPLVVVVTGTDEPHLSRAREAGADVVLPKPVTLDTLLTTLSPVVPP